MGCGASSLNQQENDEKAKNKAKRKHSSSSSSSSSDSSSDEENAAEPGDVITKTLLREYLGREINMLQLELTQPEVVLRQLLEQKDLTTQQLISNSKALEEQRAVSVREYQDIANLQLMIQQKQQVSQDKWDVEQKEYVEAYNKHKQLEEQHANLEKQSLELDIKIKSANKDVKRLLRLRKRQDHILIKTFDGGYGSEREASIEEYVDKMKEFQKNILNTKNQWKRGLDFTKQANMQYWRGVQVWTNILTHRQMATRWQYCSYVTNYLNAAQTNSRQAVGCMKAHAQIPYFTEKMFQEVEISRRNVYTACQPRFHPTFAQWLWYYQQNSAFLEKWIEKTLAQTIEGDLIKVNGYLTVAESDLRAERKRLIIEKVKEKFGEGAQSEVAEQEAEVDRLSKEVSKMQSVSIQANVMTVSTGVDSGVESEGEGPPPAAGTQSKQDVTEEPTAVSEEATKADDEQAKILAQKREEEALVAKAAEEESRKRLEEAKAKIASIESATELLEKEKAEAEAAQKEALEKKKVEEEAAAARVVAEEAAANAAAEQKDQLLKEAELAAEAAEKAKAEAMKWTQMAEEAAKKAEKEIEGSKKAAEERAAAEKEAEEAEEGARKAKEELNRLAAAKEEAESVEIVERPEKAAEEKPEEVKLEEKEADPAPNFQSDIDSIMNDYKSSVEQFNRKRGTEETRMDLDLQEKLRARRQRRRQQMKQKIQEQKLLGDEGQNGTS